MSNNEFTILASTVIDRISAKLDRFLKPPNKSRKICENPRQALMDFDIISKEEYDGYIIDLNLPNLIESIDQNLKKGLPESRYFLVKKWRDFTDWIEILVSLYCLVRATKPSKVVETGIGEIGMTSTFILRGLEDNGKGELFSIDTDKFYRIYGYHVGRGIPDCLRKNQRIVLGSSQKELIPLLKDVGPIDIFLHDGDHKYRTKYFEYETSYPHLNKGGMIVSDDTWDSSFDVFVSNLRLMNRSVKYGKGNFFSFAKKQGE